MFGKEADLRKLMESGQPTIYHQPIGDTQNRSQAFATSIDKGLPQTDTLVSLAVALLFSDPNQQSSTRLYKAILRNRASQSTF